MLSYGIKILISFWPQSFEQCIFTFYDLQYLKKISVMSFQLEGEFKVHY